MDTDVFFHKKGCLLLSSRLSRLLIDRVFRVWGPGVDGICSFGPLEILQVIVMGLDKERLFRLSEGAAALPQCHLDSRQLCHTSVLWKTISWTNGHRDVFCYLNALWRGTLPVPEIPQRKAVTSIMNLLGGLSTGPGHDPSCVSVSMCNCCSTSLFNVFPHMVFVCSADRRHLSLRPTKEAGCLY